MQSFGIFARRKKRKLVDTRKSDQTYRISNRLQRGFQPQSIQSTQSNESNNNNRN